MSIHIIKTGTPNDFSPFVAKYNEYSLCGTFRIHGFIYIHIPELLALPLRKRCPDFPLTNTGAYICLLSASESYENIGKRQLLSNIHHMNYIIGIDEAGRGPWAGPIVVGGWLCEREKYEENIKTLHGLNDSKKLSERKRENIFHNIEALQEKTLCQYTFAYREAHEIDNLGIREANRLCMQDVLLSLLQYTEENDFVDVYIDGSDNFIFEGIDYSYTFAKKRNQKEKGKAGERKEKHISYIIQGDATIPAISSASIIAKVTRDRMMCDFHENFPEYGFNIHKGYGTRKHSEALVNYGITPLHRKSYAPVKKLIF